MNKGLRPLAAPLLTRRGEHDRSLTLSFKGEGMGEVIKVRLIKDVQRKAMLTWRSVDREKSSLSF